MNCTECGELLESGECAACAREAELLRREDAVLAAYAAETEVPPMWRDLEARIRRDAVRRPAPRHTWRFTLAAAAALIIVTLGAITVFRRQAPTAFTEAPEPAAVASMKYEAAIRRVESRLRTRPALVPELTRAIDDAKRAVAVAPHDPIAVTRLVAAYDAKLDLLRDAAYEQ